MKIALYVILSMGLVYITGHIIGQAIVSSNLMELVTLQNISILGVTPHILSETIRLCVKKADQYMLEKNLA